MGEAMRRYWLPSLLASEIATPDCDPVRLRLLGEDLVAFRDTNGRPGLIAARCPHRGASLFFARNEESGLRCAYHGWKFDVAGRCLDTPNEPRLLDDIRATAYPTQEVAGVIWTYMGPPDRQPPLPSQEWMRVPADNLDVCRHLGDANWLQLLEGGIDTSHSSFLHRTFRRQRMTHDYRARSTAPKLEVVATEFGYTYAGIRHLPEENQNYVRVYQFVLPFHQMRSFEGYFGHPLIAGHIWVPSDDEHTWIWSWMYTANGEPLSPEVIDAEKSSAGRRDEDVLPASLRFKRNRDNDYLIDRRRQRTVNYTGIDVISAQDQAAQESMGPIVDRSREHLGTSDVAIIAARRLLLEACQDVEEGRDPVGSRLAAISARAAEMLLPADAPWLEAMREQLVAHV